jgi:DNA-binding beta-propeller fold protein YncE
MYVVELSNSRVQVFDEKGNFLHKWGRPGRNNGEFTNPWGISVNPLNQVIVADTGNNCIQVFESTGKFLYKFGSSGSGAGQFRSPVCVSVNQFGRILQRKKT